MILTEIEFQSAVWMKLQEHYEARLQTYYKKNSDPKADHIYLCGRISEIKSFLALSDPGPQPEFDDSKE